mmetsp:Transcript_39844/g.125163  ORF Transcript_39844/g.125163 Transcript_39844/m.125163 type:complete len:213 (-) Transcript_39844:177-815(-)
MSSSRLFMQAPTFMVVDACTVEEGLPVPRVLRSSSSSSCSSSSTPPHSQSWRKRRRIHICALWRRKSISALGRVLAGGTAGMLPTKGGRIRIASVKIASTSTSFTTLSPLSFPSCSSAMQMKRWLRSPSSNLSMSLMRWTALCRASSRMQACWGRRKRPLGTRRPARSSEGMAEPQGCVSSRRMLAARVAVKNLLSACRASSPRRRTTSSLL